MSCFAGLLNLDGAPVDPALLAAMRDRLAYRSPDGMASWIEGAIGMVHGRFWTTPEEVGEEQPLAEPEHRLWLAADLRIDNRRELMSGLSRVAPEPDGGVSDARLLLAAYRAFGVGVCDEIVGDFAFALWDGERRRLLLARDAMGVRQLYYARQGSRILFGSTIGAVLAALSEAPELNRDLIEAFLQGSYRHWIEGTVHKGVVRVAPGHSLVADAEGLQLRPWWRLGSTFHGSFATDEEWVEAFREQFESAVRCRLRSTTPIGALTGGGVDSAAIASVAHAELGAAAVARLQLFGLTFDSTPTADEGGYFDNIADRLRGVAAHRIPAEHLPLAVGRWAGDDHPLDEPEVYPFRSHTTALFTSAVRNGCRVVLAGEGANQVLRHSFYFDATALRLLGWRDLAIELPWFRDASPVRPIELLPRAFLWPLLPAALREGLRRLATGSGVEWVRPAGRGSWRRRLPPLPRRRYAVGLPRSGRWATQSIGRPFDLARHSALDVTAAHAGVEWRLPFLDRRVVDLLLHAPQHLFSWRGEDRQILRHAMIGQMPERIRLRRSKSHLQAVLDSRLKNEDKETVRQLLDNPVAQAVDFASSSVAKSVESYWNETGTAYELLSFLSLESWLRRGL